MRSAFALMVAVLLAIPAAAHVATEDVQVTAAGTCHDFTIDIETDFGECWDVKIDSPGYTVREEGLRHSFFYVPEALCDGSGSVDFRFTESGNVSSLLKLRRGSVILEKEFFVEQDCPTEANTGLVFLSALAIITILAGAAVWYRG